jgi:predicted trehalose synthase
VAPLWLNAIAAKGAGNRKSVSLVVPGKRRSVQAAEIALPAAAVFARVPVEDLLPVVPCRAPNKVVYELGYELNNRPVWVNIPLQGILLLMEGGQ